MRFLSSLLLAILATTAALAAGIDRDLGRGLAYHRVHELPADLPTGNTVPKQPTVLDLRYVQGDASTAIVLNAWVKAHATLHTPLLILANTATSHALLAPLAGPDPSGRIVVIGATGPDFTPDIAVKTTAEAERQAYDALEAGTAIDSLVVEANDKPRNDEARLARDHQTTPLPADDSIPDTVPPSAGNKPAAPKPPPLIDSALQRAVQIHRALVALKKL